MIMQNEKDDKIIEEKNIEKKFPPRHLRVPIEIRIEITKGLQSFAATSRNLALGGLSFESLYLFNIKDTVNVLLYVPVKKELELLKVASEIVWMSNQNGSWMMGVAFKKFAPGDQRRLMEWLLGCIRAQKAGQPFF